MLSKIEVSPSPHISKALSTRSVMLDVLIGLIPAVVAAVIFFRMRAVIVIVTSVAGCVATEFLFNQIRKKPNSLDDLSAVVTGVILALSLPAAVPWWVGLFGGFVAISIGKMVFGGLGANVFNPAMVSRAVLAASFGILMTTWTVPATVDQDMPKLSAEQPTAITQATPLAWAKEAVRGNVDVEVVSAQMKDVFLGEVGGCLGETSALAVLIGGAYLLLRRTIMYHVPLAIVLAVVVFCEAQYFLAGVRISPLFHVMSGGLLFCVFFIATDPVTMPLTSKGMWIFGVGVGLIIMLIRVVGEYPEGVMYAVLIMNGVTPLIDRFCRVVPTGGKPNVA